MKLVPRTSISNWAESNGKKWPYAADVACPFCNRLATFALQSWQASDPTHVRSIRARCPGCGCLPTFIWVGYVLREGDAPEGFELYIHPDPKAARLPVAGLDSLPKASEALVNAYLAAVASYNVSQPVAATVLAGRALEGLLRSLLPPELRAKSLAEQVRALPDHVDLRKPILTLADAIRKGRNLAAHFNAEKEPDHETATMVLDLLDYIFEYILVLPDQIQSLHDRIG